MQDRMNAVVNNPFLLQFDFYDFIISSADKKSMIKRQKRKAI
jgi:hypothetical protein